MYSEVTTTFSQQENKYKSLLTNEQRNFAYTEYLCTTKSHKRKSMNMEITISNADNTLKSEGLKAWIHGNDGLQVPSMQIFLLTPFLFWKLHTQRTHDQLY